MNANIIFNTFTAIYKIHIGHWSYTVSWAHGRMAPKPKKLYLKLSETVSVTSSYGAKV